MDSATGLELQWFLTWLWKAYCFFCKKKNGRPVDVENKVNEARALFAAIVECPKVKGDKLKVVVVEEGYAASST